MKLLTENKRVLISEGLNWHLKNGVPLYENVYRFGSKNYFKLFNEARKLYNKGLLEVSSPTDKFLMKTDIGKLGIYEGKVVMLDIPILIKESDLKGYLVGDVVDDIIKSIGSKFVSGQIKNTPNRNFIYLKLTDIKFGSGVVKMLKSQFGIDAKIDKTFGNQPSVSFASNKVINEAEYQGRDVELNKPKRSTGPKKYQVYVNNAKGNVVKVNFGDAKGGLTAKINDPEARRAFADRHDCKNKKDKTKAGYWSCNLPRHWKALGGSDDINTFW